MRLRTLFPAAGVARTFVALVIVAGGLAACGDDSAPPPENRASEVTEIIDPAPVQELPELAPAENMSAVATTNVVENVAAIGIEDEERLSAEEQTREDADAAGMTSRASEGESAGAETGDTSAAPVQ